MVGVQTPCSAVRVAELRITQRLRCWLRYETPEERYLAAATDVADLERRARVLERTSGGPAFVTFNH